MNSAAASIGPVRGFRLGVDFGTSHTVAVLSWPDGRVGPLLFDGSPLLPSAVCADPTGRLLAGRDAVHAARVQPESFEPHPKRRIDDGTVLLGTHELPVGDLITAVLSRIATEAARVAGGPIPHTVLTCPASWGQPRRDTLGAAASRALGLVTLTTEPVAAACHFATTTGHPLPVGGCVAVYDLGAGTFDASVVRRTEAGFEVLASEGLDDAGGVDIDAAIVTHLAESFSARNPQDWQRLVAPASAADRRASRLLWEDVRTAKEMLARAPAATLHVPIFDDEVTIGRELLDQLAAPILERTVASTRAALASAGVTPTDLTGLFLVGGSSRLSLVPTLLHRTLGIAPTVVDQPELAVADGSLHLIAAPPPPALPAEEPTALATSAPPGRWRRHRAALLAGAVVLAAAIAGTTVALAGPGDDPDLAGAAGATSATTIAPPPTPTISPSVTVSSVADPCLLGTWVLTSLVREHNIDDQRVRTTLDGETVFYHYRPDGSMLADITGQQREVATVGGHYYEIVFTGTITSNYRTSDDLLLWSSQASDGEVVIMRDGTELWREPMQAITEEGRYVCAEETLHVYYPTVGAHEFARVSHDWDE